jgi:transposase
MKPKKKKPPALSLLKFNELYPNDDVCLEAVFNMRYEQDESGNRVCDTCGTRTKYHRVKKRKCYACSICRTQIYPLAGTIMDGSNTKLIVWFYAMYLFANSKNGISAKELQWILGVTYKTAWSISNKIRGAMGNIDNAPLTGLVEIDEALIGGKVTGGKRGWGAENKTCLFGMKERGGRVRIIAVKNRERETLFPIIRLNIEKGSLINSDEFRTYRTLPDEGYEHKTVIHSKYQWAQGDTYTNSIEGYWSNLKKSILGTHTYVSPKHMQKYLDEFDFRHNHRNESIFEEVLKKIYRKPE